MEVQSAKTMNKLPLILNSIILAISGCGAPLMARLYFIHGGKRVWLSTCLQSVGFPIILIPLIAAYIRRRETEASNAKLIIIKPVLVYTSIAAGIALGIDSYLYSYGMSKLPVTTATLIISSQLAFTAGFAFLIVKQKFTFYSINAILLLTVGSAVLALNNSGDRPKGESTKEYAIGFVMTLGAAALNGFTTPMIEFAFRKAKQAVSYTIVLEFQFVMCFSATVFSIIGMFINNDFKVIPREAREFDIGEVKYYIILVLSAIIWVAFFLGSIGVLFCSSSLFAGVINSGLLPATQILPVFFFHEKFQAQKMVALILSLWGSVSYFYGEKKCEKNINQTLNVESHQDSPQTEMTQNKLIP